LFFVVLATLVCVCLSTSHYHQGHDGKTGSGGNSDGKEQDNGTGKEQGKENGDGDDGGDGGSDNGGDGDDGGDDGGIDDGDDGGNDGNDGGNDDNDDGGNTPGRFDCVVSQWGSWGSCTKSCGCGTYTRIRTVLVQPANGGAACPPLTDTQPCNTQTCPAPPVDCCVSAWGPWGSCTASCGRGTKTHTRTVTTSPRNGGHDCPPLSESTDCNTPACPPTCEMNQWQSWGSCTAPCGGGTCRRSRTVRSGSGCRDAIQETIACNTPACSRNGGGH